MHFVVSTSNCIGAALHFCAFVIHFFLSHSIHFQCLYSTIMMCLINLSEDNSMQLKADDRTKCTENTRKLSQNCILSHFEWNMCTEMSFSIIVFIFYTLCERRRKVFGILMGHATLNEIFWYINWFVYVCVINLLMTAAFFLSFLLIIWFMLFACF